MIPRFSWFRSAARPTPPARPTRGRARRAMRWMASLVLVVAVVACDAGEPDVPGTILGQVTGEGAPLPGVVVELTGPVNRVAETDAQGRFRFEGIPTGAYVVSVRNLPPDAAFPAVSRTASLTPGSTVNVDFQGNFIRTASISGAVRARGQGVGGVMVTLSGPDASTVQTGSGGSFSFPALRAGFYEVVISGFPTSITFGSTRSTVTLQPGQAHEMQFEGEPELTASVVIQGVNRLLPGGVREPVDLRNVTGLIEARVTLDRGEDRVDSLLVFLGSTLVGKQVFGEPAPVAAELAMAPAPVDLLFPIRTDAFDPATGSVTHPNGDQLLTVRLASREGGPAAWTSSVQVRLANLDTFAATLEPDRGPVTGQDGEAWIGGALEVRLLPVLYTPGAALGSATVELRNPQAGEIVRGAAVGTGPLVVRFPSGAEPSSLAGYVTPPGTVDRVRVVQARYANGTFVPGLPLTVLDSLRIDQVAPRVEAFELPRQGASSRCCLENWVGAEYTLTSALRGVEDTGVGGIVARIHAGPASASNAELLALPPVALGADLAESGSNTVYRALAVVEDALGNTRVVPLAPSPGNPVAGAEGAVFGVDRSPPSALLATGGSTLPPRSVNPPEGSAWGFSVEDPLSGIGPSPLLASVRRLGPGDPPGGTCLFPLGDSACAPQPSGLFRPIPDNSGPGYLRVLARGVDRAGNLSAPVEAWALLDQVPPQVASFFLLDSPVGGAEVGVAIDATDDVDLHRARLLARAGDVEPGAGVTVPLPLPVARIGTPFGGDPVRAASLQLRFTHIQGIQRAESGSAGEDAGGTPLATRRLRAQVEDAAGNRGLRDLEIPPAGPATLRGFDATFRGEEGAVRGWRMETESAVVCRPVGAGTCPSGSPESVRLTARGSSSGQSAPIPFARVHFFVDGADARWIGSSDVVTTSQAGGGQGWSWSFTWVPGQDVAAGTLPIRAVGVDAQGNGLLVHRAVMVEVQTPGAIGTP